MLSAMDKQRLRAALDDYDAAQLGDLVASADRFRDLCKSLGWSWEADRILRPDQRGFRAWAKRAIDQ